MTDIEKTLAERGARYGNFAEHAEIAQGLKTVMWHTIGWSRLKPDQAQALEVIADKIARILNGDPNYLDNWHDIIGYAKLIEDRLRAEAAPPEQTATALTGAFVFKSSPSAPAETPVSRDDWQRWGGGEMPVPAGTIVQVRDRMGYVYTTRAGERFAADWHHYGSQQDIIAWRLQE